MSHADITLYLNPGFRNGSSSTFLCNSEPGDGVHGGGKWEKWGGTESVRGDMERNRQKPLERNNHEDCQGRFVLTSFSFIQNNQKKNP